MHAGVGVLGDHQLQQRPHRHPRPAQLGHVPGPRPQQGQPGLRQLLGRGGGGRAGLDSRVGGGDGV